MIVKKIISKIRSMAQSRWRHHHTSVYVHLMSTADCLQVIPEDLRCSAYAFDRGIFGLLGAVAAPLVNPILDAIATH